MRVLHFALVTILVALVCGCTPAAGPSGGNSARLDGLAHVNGSAISTKDCFRFVIMSDRTGGNIPGMWPQAVGEVNLLKPEIVVTVGDFIQGYTEDVNELDRQWAEFLHETSKLNAPFFFTPGNHDVTNPTMRKLYLERFGRDGRSYYSFDYHGCHFTVLDSNLFTKQGLDPNQLAWLRADMTIGAKADHVFVLYHHPADEKSAAWKQMRPLLAEGKTTVFNGHAHWMSHAQQDGIDTYTLAATAADVGEFNPDFGDVQMFAHVTVENGQPTIAIIPVGQIMRPDHVDRAFDLTVWPLRNKCEIVQKPVPGGQRVTLVQTNNSSVTFDLSATIDAYGWQVVPRETAVTVKPGEKQEIRFELVQWADDLQAASPQVKRVYTFTEPRDRPALLNMTTALGRFSDIQKSSGIEVDGRLDDWTNVAEERLPAFGELLTDGKEWAGDDDLSAHVLLAHDGNVLYVAVNVTDNALRTGLTPATENDGFGFSWSVPKSLQSAEPNRPVSGSVRIIPVAGKIEPIWAISKRLTKPGGFKAFATHTQNGYICEIALPLAEIGARSPVEPSEILNWRLQFRDIDGTAQSANVFTIGGTNDRQKSAEMWTAGVLE